MKGHKLKKGFGLVEALIALVIIAVTMVSALETVSSALRQVKNNEIEDKANELMTSALEYAYGYRNIDLPIQSGTDTIQLSFTQAANNNVVDHVSYCYKPTVDFTTNKVTLVKVSEGIAGCGIIASPSSNYKVDYDSTIAIEESEEIYHQIIFTNVPVSGSGELTDKIRVTSVVLYTQEGTIQRQRVDAYRPIFF